MSDHCIAQYQRERWKSGGNKPERLMTMRPGNVNMEKLLQAAVTTASPQPSCVCVTLTSSARQRVTSRKRGTLADQDNHREQTGTERQSRSDGDHGDTVCHV